MSNYSPCLRLLMYPLTAQSVTKYEPFSITDDLRIMLRPDNVPQYAPLPTQVIEGVTLSEPPSITTPGCVNSSSGLRWWNLRDTSDGTMLQGYTLQDQEVPTNSLIDRSVAPATAAHCIEWGIRAGDPKLWSSVIPDYEPQGISGIAWHSSDPQVGFQAVTLKDLPRNQSFKVQLNLLGTGPQATDPTKMPLLRLTWGAEWGLLLTTGRPPQLQRNFTATGQTAPQWNTVRTAGDWGNMDMTEGPLQLGVYSMGGRLLVTLAGGGQETQMVHTLRAANKYTGIPDPINWQAAPLTVEGQGAPHTLRLSEIQYGALDQSDVPLGVGTGAGYFTRQYPTGRYNLNQPTKCAFGYYSDGSATRQPGQIGASPMDLAQIDDAPMPGKPGLRQYTCTLSGLNPGLVPEKKANAPHGTGYAGDSENFYQLDGPDGWGQYHGLAQQAMWGSTTSLVYAVSLRQASTVTTLSSAPIDLRPAIMSAQERVADPGLQAGPEWTMQLNREDLGSCPITDDSGNPTSGVVGRNWSNYVEKYHACRVLCGWYDETGTLGPVYDRLIGFCMSRAPKVARYGEWTDTLSLRDWTCRLQKPAAVIDGGYGPLDLVAAEIQDQGRTTFQSQGLQTTLYGVDAIYYILGVALGPNIAEALWAYQSWGDYAGRPIYGVKAFLQPPGNGGFMWPPPFNASAWDWIQEICKLDFSVFCAGQALDPNGSGAINFAPIYGNYYSIVNTMPSIPLPDMVYEVGDNSVMATADLREMPGVDYNDWLVYAQPPGGNIDLMGLFPVAPGFSAEARIQTSSVVPEQGIDKTWRRSIVEQNPYSFTPQMTSYIAFQSARWRQDINAQAITLRTATNGGIPQLWWGWKVVPKMVSNWSDGDIAAQINGKSLRVMRIENDWDFMQQKAGTWTTTMNVIQAPAHLG
jgi:hypothetical protein